MLRRTVAVILMLTGGLVVMSAAKKAHAQQLPSVAQRYERAGELFASRLRDLVFNENVKTHWIDEAPRLWYVSRPAPDVKRFVLVLADEGVKRDAFDHDRLAAALGKATEKQYDPDNLPFDDLAWLDDMKAIRFQAEEETWRCDLQSYAITKFEAEKAENGNGENDGENRRGRRGRRGEARNLSADGKWEVLVENYNLVLKNRETEEKKPLTHDGAEDYFYANPQFSPDSKHVAVFRTHPGDNRKMYRIESLPKEGGLRPKLHEAVYPLPGDRMDLHDLWIFEIPSGERKKADHHPIDFWGPPEVEWTRDGSALFFHQMHRGYQKVTVSEIDVNAAAARTVLTETTEFSIMPARLYAHYMLDANELIWMSERDGHNHLYLYDLTSGTVKNQITKGPWMVRGVEFVDEENRQIVFTGSGRQRGKDPYLIHYYRVGFDGEGLVDLTPENAHHEASFSPDRRFMVDRYSRVDLAPVSVLRDAATGKVLCRLEEADVSKLLETGWRWPEPFVAKGRDGRTDIWGVIFRPAELNEKAKYPVLDSIYSGPHGSHVPKSFREFYWWSAWTELGFTVVQIDGMGTANRSKAFRGHSYKNLADAGLPDHVAWIKAVAKKYPYVDAERVGIFGGSAGGYDSTRALLAHPEFFKAAASNAGNHDHRTDKVWWNELWMGYPVGPQYAEQSNVTNADKLEGDLLLIHGELDSNVYMSAGTLPLVDALIKANKDFELLVVPGAGHCPGGPYVLRRQWDFFVRSLRGETPPKNFKIPDEPQEEPEETPSRKTVTTREEKLKDVDDVTTKTADSDEATTETAQD